MKKRLIALSLVLVFALALAIPSLAALDAAKIGAAASGSTDTNHLYEKGSYTHYAFQKTADIATKKISWKEIKDTDLTVDGKLDLSKVVKEAGALFFGNGTDLATNSSLLDNTYKYIEIGGVAEKPAKPAVKGTDIVFTDTSTGTSMTITVAAGTEYAPLNGQTWTPANGTKITIPLTGTKQDYVLRVAASGATAPSPSVKFSVPAKAAAPKVAVDVTKGIVKVKSTYEFAMYSNSSTWTPVGDVKDLEISSLENHANGGSAPWFRVAADPAKGKPPSAAVQVDLNIPENPDVALSHFSMAAKGVVLVTGDVIMEYDNSGTWKKTKKLTKDQVTTGVNVRIAGSKTTLPGPEYTLKYNGTSKQLELAQVQTTP